MQAILDTLSALQTRHPLLLFTLLGVFIFWLTWEQPAVSGAAPLPEPVILPDTQLKALRAAYPDRDVGRLSAKELHGVLGEWLDHQVLVREGRRLGLDRADPIIERRIAQRMDTLLQDLHPLPEPGDLALQKWMREQDERFGDPPRYTFEQVFLARGQYGSTSPQVAADMLQRLRTGKADFRALGSRFITGPVVRDITPAELRKHFGQQFSNTLQEVAPGSWQGPLASGYGLHLVRVTDQKPFQPWLLASHRARIEREYRIVQQQTHVRRLRNQLIEKYGVQPPPARSPE